MSIATRRTSVSSLSNSQGQPGPPILLNGPRSSSAAGSSAGYSPSLSTSSFVSELVSPHQLSSAKIHFAPLPQVPPDLKRRSSITLGVAARKHLLSNQSQQAKPGTVYMTDDQWELYKKQYEANNWSEPVDIGEIAKSGAKSIWRRMRSASSASSWNSPSPSPYGSSWSSPAPLASPRRIPGERRGSVPNLSSRPPTPLAEPSLDTVKEEDKLSGLHITTSSPPPDDSRRSSESFNAWSWKGGHGAGEATPRRFPSPPPRNTVLPEDDEEVEERQEAVQAISPPRSPIRHTPAEGPVAPVPSRRRQAAVLGFDEARYGR